MIKGIHHVSMKCETPDEVSRVKEFYLDVLELSILREWSEGFMIDTGNGLIEVFTNGNGEHHKGIIRHIALLTDDVDEITDRVKAAGYDVFIEPNNLIIDSSPEYPVRMAFCHGPLGEEIEFFSELKEMRKGV